MRIGLILCGPTSTAWFHVMEGYDVSGRMRLKTIRSTAVRQSGNWNIEEGRCSSARSKSTKKYACGWVILWWWFANYICLPYFYKLKYGCQLSHSHLHRSPTCYFIDPCHIDGAFHIPFLSPKVISFFYPLFPWPVMFTYLFMKMLSAATSICAITRLGQTWPLCEVVHLWQI